MNWTRLADVNGFARWRKPSGDGLANHILANRQGIIVAVGGRIFAASTQDELEGGLAGLFGRVTWDVYRCALAPILEAFRVVTGRAVVVDLGRIGPQIERAVLASRGACA